MNCRRFAAVLAALAFALELPLPAAEPPPAAPVAREAPAAGSLADVSFLSGRWRNEEKGSLSEEVWAPPAGDSMVGMWRLALEGKAQVFELLTLLEEGGKVTLRLRHFHRDGVAWEDKDRPLVLPLVAKGPGKAVFEGEGSKGRLRITYEAPAPDRLETTVESGPKPPQRYSFRRVPGP